MPLSSIGDGSGPMVSQPQVRITPLFHSASITLYGMNSTHSAWVEFSEQGQEDWNEALPLVFDPIEGALSGSLVRLKPDTPYQVRLALYANGDFTGEQQYQFRTRANHPPVDPERVYRLADIYQGGTLDLEALGIEGRPGGWAKIVGDKDTWIRTEQGEKFAINIGDNSYIHFENIQVDGGGRHAVTSLNAHHLWFSDCEISGWGREAGIEKDGLAYENEQATEPINYDAGFHLRSTGVVVVEDCQVHSPVPAANHWGDGHPQGATAFLVLANHPNPDYQGQYVLRHNRFFGTNEHRFNDVIESRSNGQPWGGFLRDSAIHDNYLAYANDDLIELDGGQHNVLVYDNVLEQGYTGISAVPNMLGPSYIFNNFIHNLGDERQKAWAAIKLGGLQSAPAGLTHIFGNLIISRSNGIAAAAFKGDSSYWVHAQNNVLVHDRYWQVMGYGIYDKKPTPASRYLNNYIFNLYTGQSEFEANLDVGFHDTGQLNQQFALDLAESWRQITLDVPESLHLPNFSRTTEQGELIIGVAADLSSTESQGGTR
ncbi:hypothetical protein [Bowmanella dokdonensis]|uniref:Right handed beta helix domain-containing protein n=1 Tax=Bowmanella dokdonensis TaxID=751969 RepID=A0A939DL24_9ALTE|nr:hypothetical protein [Bowmanella dokdonensis]MBN7824688.1 hypothetical protein [Bowmanella dokdonensis]